jgi:hypothetical protein
MTNVCGFTGVALDEFGMPIVEDDADDEVEGTTAGRAPKKARFHEGVSKYNKTDTKQKWREFGGDACAVFLEDGSATITRVTEHAGKRGGTYMKLEEVLHRCPERYGKITWKLEVGGVTKKQRERKAFDEAWIAPLIVEIRNVINGEKTVGDASRELAAAFDASHATMRANIWVATKWANGIISKFPPQNPLVRPIATLLCEMGYKENVIISLQGYSASPVAMSDVMKDVLAELLQQK